MDNTSRAHLQTRPTAQMNALARAIGMTEVLVMLIGLAACAFVGYTLWTSAKERDAADAAFSAASTVASRAAYLWQDVEGKPAGTPLGGSGLSCAGACTPAEALRAAAALENVPESESALAPYAAPGPTANSLVISEPAAEGKEQHRACVSFSQGRFIATQGPCPAPSSSPAPSSLPAAPASSAPRPS